MAAPKATAAHRKGPTNRTPTGPGPSPVHRTPLTDNRLPLFPEAGTARNAASTSGDEDPDPHAHLATPARRARRLEGEIGEAREFALAHPTPKDGVEAGYRTATRMRPRPPRLAPSRGRSTPKDGVEAGYRAATRIQTRTPDSHRGEADRCP